MSDVPETAGLPRKPRAGKRRQRAHDSDDEDTAAGTIKQARTAPKGGMQLASASDKAAQVDETQFKSAGEIQQRSDGGVFRHLDVSTQEQAAAELSRASAASHEDDGLYRGMKGYKDWREVSAIC